VPFDCHMRGGYPLYTLYMCGERRRVSRKASPETPPGSTRQKFEDGAARPMRGVARETPACGSMKASMSAPHGINRASGTAFPVEQKKESPAFGGKAGP